VNDFPRMVYRAPGTEDIHGHKLASMIVHSHDELQDALADGWHLSTPEAIDAFKTPQATVGNPADAAVAQDTLAPDHATISAADGPQGGDDEDDAPPTRAEMEAQAAKLGIKADKRWGDARLLAEIEKKLKD
jgi:hypothetical protein